MLKDDSIVNAIDFFWIFIKLFQFLLIAMNSEYEVGILYIFDIFLDRI